MVDCRTITSGDKAGARIISFDPSHEFMEWLKTTRRSDKFRMAHKKIYINGGHRLDGGATKNTPPLTPQAATSFLTGAADTIFRSAARQHGVDGRYTRLITILKIYLLTYNPKTYFSFLTGERMQRRTKDEKNLKKTNNITLKKKEKKGKTEKKRRRKGYFIRRNTNKEEKFLKKFLKCNR